MKFKKNSKDMKNFKEDIRSKQKTQKDGKRDWLAR